ncbi:class I SAM-dependent methyltransferase [Pelobacter seleniigenes]|uniref:class I SAM-dependent methyltransferase n=1 Tax=Pelobacter seleniigenes TaxID=407188 RepID=UPI0004A76F6B|nr:class I SAM-dependent methyltransferase [Pelobacter seleniigenes]
MTFEFDGEKYRKASTHQKEWGAKLIAEFSFKGTEQILDLGCGDGAITAKLAEQVPNGHVLGIDASEGMIASATHNHRLPNLEFQRVDINAIRYTEKFDIIISNATLHWIKDHRNLLTNVHAALKDHGVARFNFAADGNCSHFFAVIKKVIALPAFAKYFSSFVWPWYMPDIEDYRTLAARVPFAQLEVWGENADRYFPDAEALIRWIDQPSLVPFIKCVAEPDRAEFRSTVVNAMLQETVQPNGTYFETFRRINLRAGR